MALPPEVQKQLDEQKKTCPFCKIIKGEIESKQVYKDDKIICILDINPVVNGHTLLVPKEHYPILPMLPPELFKHIFTLMPMLAGAIKEGMLATGINVIIANGGVAGQKSPHFLIHMLPREGRDGFDKCEFAKEQLIDNKKQEEIKKLLMANIPAMMKSVKKEAGKSGKIKDEKNALYEDDKALCVLYNVPQATGHVAIYSKEELDFEKLGGESSFQLFSLASFCSSILYEGLKAHGTNIILKAGKSDDNPDGKIAIHIIPRFDKDGFDFIGAPMKKIPELKKTQSEIKDKMFIVEHSQKKAEKPIVINLDEEKKIVYCDKPKKAVQMPPEDEIRKAMDEMMR